jgi:predicted protein tyrosine phosphatase
MIHVCPLSKIEETVWGTGAERLITLINAGTPVVRPASILAEHHLRLSMNDIAEAQEGMTLPGQEHVAALLDFARNWSRARPLVVHCYAGISRSTASAYIMAAALSPKRDEFELAAALRRASPTATPNVRLIALADALMDRRGRMVEAICGIGRGAEAFEGLPFELALES